ncbi:MAG: radical SAM protein [Candidatus Omnitrophota bacterium]
MRITLIRPNIGYKDNKPYFDTGAMEPLTIAVLAGLTPLEHEIVFYDDRIEPVALEEQTDLVAITVESYTAKRSYQLADHYRQRGIPVVLGGYHPTLAPQEAAAHADSVVIGEAEGVWPMLLEDAQRGVLKKFYKSDQRPSLSGIKPRRDIFKDKKYLPVSLVEFGRGCKYGCEFCAIYAFYKSYDHRPAQEVADEVAGFNRHHIVFFIDDNIVSDHAAAKELFRKLIPLKIRWVGQASIDFAGDDELLGLMKESGCLGIVIGFESLEKENLGAMKKEWNTSAGSYEQALDKIRAKGIMIWAAFLFGYDHDSPQTFQKTLDFTIRRKFAFLATNHLMPYPGTALYERLKTEGRLVFEKWWIDPGYHFGASAVRPLQMTPEVLSRQCFETRKAFYSPVSILRRAFDTKAQGRNLFTLLAYFRYNWVFRREMLKKQGMEFGGMTPF